VVGSLLTGAGGALGGVALAGPAEGRSSGALAEGIDWGQVTGKNRRTDFN
jgi:hypothetical protein